MMTTAAAKTVERSKTKKPFRRSTAHHNQAPLHRSTDLQGDETPAVLDPLNEIAKSSYRAHGPHDQHRFFILLFPTGFILSHKLLGNRCVNSLAPDGMGGISSWQCKTPVERGTYSCP